MPSWEQHQKASEHNRAFSEEKVFDSQQYDDWKIISIFYSAVHIIESYFDKTSGIGSGGHDQRFDLMIKDPRLHSIMAPYDELFDFSMRFRYKCEDTCSENVVAAQQDLRQIRSHIQTLLS